MPLLQHAVTAQAEARPDARAIVWRNIPTTYAELEQRSNQLAQLLVDVGCERGERVALLMPKQPEAITAMLGALKAGAAYVPLDPGDSTARLALTLESADCRWILCAGNVDKMLEKALSTARLARSPLVGRLDNESPSGGVTKTVFVQRDLEVFPNRAPDVAGDENDLAHILFTSGSTGVPKGVTITHSNVVHFLDWAGKYFGITSSDRISQHASLRFDISGFDIFGTLWAGAELHLVPPELNLLPPQLANFIRDSELTQWFSVPSVLNLMAKFDVIRARDFPMLKRVLFAGEVLPTPTLIHWMRRLPHVRFTNLYGPTETTISSSFYTPPQCPSGDQEPIPIGRACEGEELLVLDDKLRVVRDGDVGDLYIRGVGLSPGYWRDPEKTKKAFVSAPSGIGPPGRMYKTGDRARRGADGLYYFCGRADTQIKSRGYRIELGEIEAALHSVPELHESAVVPLESDGFEGTLICCAYAPAPGAELSLEQLRGRLAELLPGYMLPARWRRYATLPKNGNGKLDRPLIASEFRDAEMRQGSETHYGRSPGADKLLGLSQRSTH